MSEVLQIDNPELYEEPVYWDRSYDRFFYEKKRLFQGLIGPGVQSVLDLGCGQGELSRDLCPGRSVVGCDRSQEALQRVTGPCVRCSSDALPFGDRSFDLVLCSQVLEHLPEPVYRGTLQEMARVAARHIIVSVPYRETLVAHMTACWGCGAAYHMSSHVRRFSAPAELTSAFPGFTETFIGYLGARDHRLPGWLVRLRRACLGDWPWAPFARCPLCGRKARAGTSSRNDGPLKWILDRIQWRLAGPPEHRWLIVRLSRQDAEAC